MYHYQTETERLILRPFTLDDAEAFFEFNKDPEVVQYTGNPPTLSIEEAKEIIEQVISPQYSKNGMGRLAVIKKENQEIIGFCGLKFIEEENETDLGYRFLRSEWGKGYATESAKAVLKHGFEDLGLERIIARADKRNTASIHVIQKLGMNYVSETICEMLPSLKYEITHYQWLELIKI